MKREDKSGMTTQEKIVYVQDVALKIFRGIHGVTWDDEKILNNEFDLDPDPLVYELLFKEFKMDIENFADDCFDSVEQSIHCIVEKWNGIKSKESAINIQDGTGTSLLHLACQNGNTVQARELIKGGADIDLMSGWGLTPMHEAIRSKSSKVLEVLIESGADISMKDPGNGTYLHHAVGMGDLDILNILISADVQMNDKDDDGWAPIWHALDNAEVFEFLLMNGVDHTIKNPHGMTLIEAAIELEKEDIQSLLKKYDEKG